LRHFVEMFAGMAVLGRLTQAVFAAAGGSLIAAPGSIRVLLMGLDMTVPMLTWMRYRGHPRARNAEMAASMMVLTLGAAALAAAA
jgi:hypothetical protein